MIFTIIQAGRPCLKVGRGWANRITDKQAIAVRTMRECARHRPNRVGGMEPITDQVPAVVILMACRPKQS